MWIIKKYDQLSNIYIKQIKIHLEFIFTLQFMCKKCVKYGLFKGEPKALQVYYAWQ